MRLYLHANQINPALSATLSGLKEAINTQEQKEAPEKNMSNSGAVLPLIEGYVLCTRPEEKFLPLQRSSGCACKPQPKQLGSVSCYFLSLSVGHSTPVTPCVTSSQAQQLVPCPRLFCAGLLLALPSVTPRAPEHRALWKWKCLSLLSLLPLLCISIVTQK